MTPDVQRGRLAIIVASMRAGGAERVAFNLAEEFARRGLAVDLVLVEATGPFLDRVPAGVRVVDLGAKRARGAVRSLRGYLRREQPAAVLSIAFQTNILTMTAALGLRTKPRILLSVHSAYRAMLDVQRPFTRVALRLATRLLYPRADRLVAVSGGASEELREGLGLRAGAVETIYNPVLRDDYAEAMNGDAAKLPPLAADEKLIVTVGRLTQAKDQSTLIRAFALTAGRRPVKLALVGEGEMRGRLEALARDLGVADRVQFTGHVDNPYPYLRAADLFVLSSVREGFGNVLVEAMAAGTPVVSADCPHGPREILEDGRWGRLVPPRDPEALAAAIEETLDGGGIDARERAEAFTVAHAADLYLSLMMP